MYDKSFTRLALLSFLGSVGGVRKRLQQYETLQRKSQPSPGIVIPSEKGFLTLKQTKFPGTLLVAIPSTIATTSAQLDKFWIEGQIPSHLLTRAEVSATGDHLLHFTPAGAKSGTSLVLNIDQCALEERVPEKVSQHTSVAAFPQAASTSSSPPAPLLSSTTPSLHPSSPAQPLSCAQEAFFNIFFRLQESCTLEEEKKNDGHRSILFAADSPEDASKWIKLIRGLQQKTSATLGKVGRSSSRTFPPRPLRDPPKTPIKSASQTNLEQIMTLVGDASDSQKLRGISIIIDLGATVVPPCSDVLKFLRPEEAWLVRELAPVLLSSSQEMKVALLDQR